MSDTATGFQV